MFIRHLLPEAVLLSAIYTGSVLLLQCIFAQMQDVSLLATAAYMFLPASESVPISCHNKTSDGPRSRRSIQHWKTVVEASPEGFGMRRIAARQVTNIRRHTSSIFKPHTQCEYNEYLIHIRYIYIYTHCRIICQKSNVYDVKRMQLHMYKVDVYSSLIHHLQCNKNIQQENLRRSLCPAAASLARRSESAVIVPIHWDQWHRHSVQPQSETGGFNTFGSLS